VNNTSISGEVLQKQHLRARAVLRPYPGGFLWVVERCPACGQKHVHGGGPADGNPRDLLTHRVGHCRSTAARGYILTEVGE
jgi:hypothetical protein